MTNKVTIILLLLIFFGGCCPYQELVPKVKMECLSNGLIIFNQDGIYYIPKDSCCFIQESDKDIDGLILVNRICTDTIRSYEYDDMERLKAVKYYYNRYAPNVGQRTVPGVNDDTYFIKRNFCYMLFAQIRMYSYGEIDKRLDRIYPWLISIAGQNIRANIVDGRRVFFDIERTESIDSIQLADFLKKLKSAD